MGTQGGSVTVDREIDKSRSQKSPSKDTHRSFRRVRRPAVPKESLTDSAIPSASPEAGLHGFFMGGKGGPHFAHFDWQTVTDMQVESDADIEAYSKLSERSSDYTLTPWSSSEREKWGLPAVEADTSSSHPGSLPQWGSSSSDGSGNSAITRSEVLEVSGLSDAELSKRLSAARLPQDADALSLEQINDLDIYVDTVTLTIER